MSYTAWVNVSAKNSARFPHPRCFYFPAGAPDAGASEGESSVATKKPVEPKVTRRSIADYLEDHANANKGSERGLSMVEESLSQDGAGRSIVVDAENRIVAGNKTWEASALAGIEDVIEVETDGHSLIVHKRRDWDLTDVQGAARRYAYRDNRASEVSLTWDAEQLLADVNAGFDFEHLFSEGELAELLAGLDAGNAGKDPGAQVDRAAELQQKWQTAAGQLWVIGKHRLLCGDSRRADDVARVMGDDLASCMWTDPPYGVSYVGKTDDALTLQNDDAGGLDTLLRDAFAAADTALDDGAAIYIAHPPGALSVTFGVRYLAQGWRLHQTLTWVKDSMVLGHSDYHYKHEPILFGYKGGGGRRGRGGEGWYGDNSQTSVLVFDRPKASEEHPTMKPVELVAYCLKNSSPVNGIVYDGFGGSGTTMVAGEQLGRRTRLIELDPRYCAVILERMSAMGLTPELQA